MNHDEDYNNGQMPGDQELPWYDDGSSEENYVASWTNSLMSTIYEVMTSLEYAIGGVETFINTAEFMEQWYAGEYFQSGYFFGSGLFGTLYLWYDFFLVYAENLMVTESEATDTDGTNEDH
jgi:hypothetical protein